TINDRDVFVLYKAGLTQAGEERGHGVGVGFSCGLIEEPDHRHRGLLRARREGPCGRAADQRDEPPAFHSITSSARASSVGGSVRPSVFAVLRLMVSSYFVGACTGRSAGFSPLRMRST